MLNMSTAYKPDGQARGFAHIEYVNADDAAEAVKSSSEEALFLLDRTLRVDFAGPKQTRSTPAAPEPSNKLYFSSLGSEGELRSTFQSIPQSPTDIYFCKSLANRHHYPVRLIQTLQ